MTKIIGSPTRYIQGRNELENLYEHIKNIGKHFFILTSNFGRDRMKSVIEKSVGNHECSIIYEDFNGECCMSEINRIVGVVKESNCDVIVGIGGGKIHDTAKAVAYYASMPVVIVPTIASTDAPCSALSVIYTDDGLFDHYLFLPSSPNIVLVDTDIISKAPIRLLISGMGDALATYFEARACLKSNAVNCIGGKGTLAANALAKLCYDTLIENGVAAVKAVKEKRCTKAVENIIEANTYLSGIGFESGGLAGAHAIHNGLTVMEETHSMYHGEKVAFGTLVQLVLENAPKEELNEVLSFCRSVGLPTTLADLGVMNIDAEKIMEVAKLACAPSNTLGNMPFEVTPEAVYAAIIEADALGKIFK